MKRSLWVALLVCGAGWNAAAQDLSDGPPPASDPAAGGVDAAADPADPGFEADDPALDPAVGPLAPDPNALPGADPFPSDTPAHDTESVRPGENLQGAEPLEPGLPGSEPLDPNAIDPEAFTPGRDTPNDDPLPDTILDATPVPENDLPPSEAATLPGIDARNADGLGAPLIEEGVVPESRTDDLPPTEIDPRLPIERQPLDDPALDEPLPADPDVFPPAARRRPVIDPAYAAPAPPRPRPQIEIDEVVRNPVRVYETRLLVLMGHAPAAEEAIDILARRFPTDARVPYLRFFHLSRTGQRDSALDALHQAVAMERLYPVTDYNRFMEPLQGPDRYYAERVRRASAELAAADGLVEPIPDDVLSEELREEPADEVDATDPPLPAEPTGRRRPAAGPPEVIDEYVPAEPAPGEPLPPAEEPVPNAAIDPGFDPAREADLVPETAPGGPDGI